MEFTKLQGTGNDFIFINQLNKQTNEKLKNYSKAAQKLCDRHYGIGADGLITVLKPENKKNEFKMRIFNADGSEAEMCGNGIRCFAHYTYNLVNKRKIKIETKAGIIQPEIIEHNNYYSQVKVNMGFPNFIPSKIPTKIKTSGDWVEDYQIKIDEKTFNINCVSMGNPHTIIFLETIENIKLQNWGGTIENLEVFPEKTNVEFIEIISREEIAMKVWERGSGITLACGTGACAAAVAGIKKGLLNKKVTVRLPGGTLKVSWTGQKDDPVYMTGPAAYVFQGNCNVKNLLRGDINGNS